MAMIIELIVAIIVGIMELLIGLIELLIPLAFTVFEVLFIAITQGFSKARERAKSISSERKALAEEKAKNSKVETPFQRRVKIVILIGFLVTMIAGGTYWYVSAKITAKKVEATKTLVNQIVDEIAEQITAGKVTPAPGILPTNDAWNQPLELSLDDFELAMLIVVRSAGPDQKTGTIDDVLDIRLQVKPVKQIAANAGNALADIAKDQLQKRLKREPKKEP